MSELNPTARVNALPLRLLLALLLLFVVGLAARPALAADDAACAYYRNGRASRAATQTFEQCAYTVRANATFDRSGWGYGAWAHYTLAVHGDGSVYYRADGSHRWTAWGLLTTAAANDSDGDGITNDSDACPAQRENSNGVFDTDGCADTIHDLLNFVAADLDGYWSETMRANNLAYTSPRRLVYYTSRSAAEYNAYYLGRTHGIYYDVNLMTDHLNHFGDFAPVTILAHEWGHSLQATLGLLDGSRYTIQNELQADCFAGVYARHAEEAGYLESGDLEEGAFSLFNAGDAAGTPWFDVQAHGSGEQRQAAFHQGYAEGLAACFGY